LYLTSSFAFDSIDQGIRIFNKEEEGHVYGRYGNPTIEAVATKIAALEAYDMSDEAYGIMCSSGMAAIHTLVLSMLKSGDKMLAHGNLYGGTTELFTNVMHRCGIVTILIDFTNPLEVEHALKTHACGLIFFETPANPTCTCIDIKEICSLAKKYHVPVVVDNTIATPYLQRPLTLGADFVIHSTTKYLNGHGNSTAGIIVGRDLEFMKSRVWQTIKLAGTNASPMDAWLVHQGMKTLALRMERHSTNAMALATYLQEHPAVDRVNYTGLDTHPQHDLACRQMQAHGGMLSFELKGGLTAGIKAMRKIQFCVLAPTLGDVDTLVLHPASMSHVNIASEVRMANGITDGLIRVSVGIEHSLDIIADIDQAISAGVSG
jgi:methionine-gamma-lyase